MTVAIIFAVLAFVVAYAIGSINFAIIISNIWIKRDIRKFGSGNAGATNVVRSVGVVPGILTFVMDFLKGVAAAYLGFVAFGYLANFVSFPIINAISGAYLCGTVCQLGHIFPLFFDFKGGKGVATTGGILLILDWRILVVCLLAFGIPFAISGIISLGSCITAVAMLISAIVFSIGAPLPDFIFRIVLAAIMVGAVLIRHRDNIIRLSKGEEKPIIKKKNEDKNG